MSDTALLVVASLELIALLGLFYWRRVLAKRHEAGRPRPHVVVRAFTALVLLFVVVGFFTVPITFMCNKVHRHDHLRERLTKTGEPATAVITDIRETGTVLNRRPEVQVWMTVQPEAGRAFRSQARWAFSVSDVQNYRVGTKVRVYFDPADRGEVAVVGRAAP